MTEEKILEEINSLTKEDYQKVEKRARFLLNEAIKSRYNELAKLIVNKIPKLIKQGINKHESPLHMAAREDNEKIVEFFIKSNLDINNPNERGNTPLHEAVLNNSEKATKTLLSNNPDLKVKNNVGDTAIDIAFRRYEASKMDDKSIKGDKQVIKEIYELVKNHKASKNSTSKENTLPPQVDYSVSKEPKEENYSQEVNVESFQSAGASNGETHLNSIGSSRTAETTIPERPPRTKKAAPSEAAISEIPSRAEAKAENEPSSMGCKESFSAMTKSLRKSFRKKKDFLVKKMIKK